TGGSLFDVKPFSVRRNFSGRANVSTFHCVLFVLLYLLTFNPCSLGHSPCINGTLYADRNSQYIHTFHRSDFGNDLIGERGRTGGSDGGDRNPAAYLRDDRAIQAVFRIPV